MKLLSLRRNPDDPTEVEVHLELVATFRAVVESVFWYALWLLLGAALYRAYLHWPGF